MHTELCLNQLAKNEKPRLNPSKEIIMEARRKKKKEFKEPQQQSNVKIFPNYPPEWETGVVTNWPSLYT